MKQNPIIPIKLLSFLILCALLTSVGFRPATASAEVRVGYVDLQRALASSRPGKKAQKRSESEVKKVQSELDVKKNEFESLRKSFTKQRDSLNEAALAEKEEELLTLERDIKRSFQDARGKLQRKNATMVGELVNEIRQVVAEVGQSEGFTVILEKGSKAVLYADNSIDITDEVVKAFDKQGSKK